MTFEDIFRQVTNTEWNDEHKALKVVAENKFESDKGAIPDLPEIHDIAVSYYVMHLLSQVQNGAKVQESLGDYYSSKAHSRFDEFEPWLGKYLSFLNEFREGFIHGVPEPETDPMTLIDGFDDYDREILTS